MEVKEGVRNSIILPNLSYASETRTWNVAQESQIQAIEMMCLKGACGVSRWDGKSNDSVHNRFGMGMTAGEGVDCGVVEWVMYGTQRWFRHMTKMNEDNFV